MGRTGAAEVSMKAKADFILRQIADEFLLIPVGEAALKMNGLVRLSESGYLLFGKLQEHCSREDLVCALLTEYEVSRTVAEADVDEFLATLKKYDMLEQAQKP